MVEPAGMEATMYAWIITRDHLLDPKVDEHDEDCDGTAGPRGASDALIERAVFFGDVFRMVDGDNNVIYEGRLWTDDPGASFDPGLDQVTGFEPLDDFGMPYAGCAHIEYLRSVRGTLHYAGPHLLKVPALDSESQWVRL